MNGLRDIIFVYWVAAQDQCNEVIQKFGGLFISFDTSLSFLLIVSKKIL